MMSELDAILLGAKLYQNYLGMIQPDDVQVMAVRFEYTTLVPGGFDIGALRDEKKKLMIGQQILELRLKYKGTTVLAK